MNEKYFPIHQYVGKWEKINAWNLIAHKLKAEKFDGKPV
jgi:hypothetical protein